MTDPLETPVTSTWSPKPVTQGGPSGQTAKPAAALRLESIVYVIGTTIVRSTTAELESGQAAALTGPVGCGKSTLLKVIGGVHRIQSGNLWLNGCDAAAIPSEERGISWVPQGGGLFPAIPVWKQIGFPLYASGIVPRSDLRIRAHEAAERWEVTDLLDRQPESLSGGERQLVALARATIHSTSGLMLDEPYSALSDARRNFAMTRLDEWRKRNPLTWIIHASHRPEEIADADVSWRIDDGCLQAAAVAR